MTNTKTMIAIASLLTATIASSAFASEGFLSPNVQNFPQNAQYRNDAQVGATQNGTNAYAQAPSRQQRATFSNEDRREFNRTTDSALFDR